VGVASRLHIILRFFYNFLDFKRFPSCSFVFSCIPLLRVEFPDTEAVYPDANVVAVWHPAHQVILAGSAVHCQHGNAYSSASQDGINTSWLAAYTDGLVPLEASKAHFLHVVSKRNVSNNDCVPVTGKFITGSSGNRVVKIIGSDLYYSYHENKVDLK